MLDRINRMVCNEVEISELGVRDGETVANLGRKGRGISHIDLTRTIERRLRLVEAAEIIENDATVQVRFRIRRIKPERIVEVLKRFLEPTEHGETQAGLVLDIGEVRILLKNTLEGIEGSLEVVALPGADALGDDLSRRSLLVDHQGSM
ncbi:MAG: hypothetical protein OXU33_05520, partial [Gemmatimonadota bacterium]|nr:hypothetical protein [Gemmatimonadota bacterium]